VISDHVRRLRIRLEVQASHGNSAEARIDLALFVDQMVKARLRD
jgi:hypothetical protein